MKTKGAPSAAYWRARAIHEAAHAVVAYIIEGGLSDRGVQIKPRPRSWSWLPTDTDQDEASALIAFAGDVAEIKASGYGAGAARWHVSDDGLRNEIRGLRAGAQ